MAKDYIQDIVPPEKEERPSSQRTRKLNIPPPSQEEKSDDSEVPDVGLHMHTEDSGISTGQQNRSIQNIVPSKARMRMSADMRGPVEKNVDRTEFSRRRIGMWILAGLAVLVVGILGLFAFRNSTVTVTPRSQLVTFDETSHFSAFPEASAAPTLLSYKVIMTDIEDSEPVAAQGMQHAETKASGTITVYNAYSASPVRLIKNTRFQSDNGLVFRAPADILVPGKKGSTPGSINVMVVADKAGNQYNIAPTQFTLPGLQSTPVMYKGISAKSTTSFAGGFVGDQPAVAPATLAAAISAVRARLAEKVLQSGQANEEYILLPDLAQITYQSQQSTTEAGGGVRIHEKAHVDMIAFPKDLFAQSVAKSVTADAENVSISLYPGTGFTAHTNSKPTSWGIEPIDFNLTGQAQLIWNVDTVALAKALSGRDESAFQTIVAGFPGIQEAHARIQPFWKNTFPTPAKINVTVVPPATSQ
ncbi:MAG: hypothetical protein Q8R25_03105 [bacterium]|nr:hypothetical protein [bacterium]